MIKTIVIFLIFGQILLDQKTCTKSIIYISTPYCTESHKKYIPELINKIIYKENIDCSVKTVGLLHNNMKLKINSKLIDSLRPGEIKYDFLIVDNNNNYLNQLGVEVEINVYPALLIINNNGFIEYLEGTREIFNYAHY